MNIDEAIEDLKECDSCQVAEWLEELKFLRTTKETMYREIYNQALEDFAEEFKTHCRKFTTKSISDADVDWIKNKLMTR